MDFFNHRKLLYDSPEPDIEELCPKFCNSVDDHGYCSISCSSCPLICYSSFPPFYPPPTPPHPIKSHKLSLPFTLSLVILAIAFSLFCCYSVYRYCSYRFGSRGRGGSQPPIDDTTRDDFLNEDRGPMVDHPIWFIRTVGLQQSLIDSITVFKYMRGDGLVEGTECSVCLNEFREDETLRLLPKCNHAFHLPCIDTWLRSHTNCPMCRAGIFPTSVAVAASSSTEVAVESSGDVEETQMGESGNGDVLGGEREEEAEFENGLKRIGSDLQPIRRSVSMDSVSASLIRLAIANNDIRGQFDEVSNTQLGKFNESNVENVPKRVRLVGTSSIRRSLSCSGVILMSRYTRSRSSALPL